MKTIYGNLKILLILTLSVMSFASCSEDESIPPTAGYRFVADDLTVNFTNTSENATSYEWDFGDGNTSTEENPSHTYAATGTYTVGLKAMGNDVDIVEAYIDVKEYIDPADLRTIVFITEDESKENGQIEWLESNPRFVVTTEYYSSLSTASQADIDMLNAADLVIIGRSGSSGDFAGDDKLAWNGLTTPLILNSQWAARSNRLNWFDHSDNPQAFAPDVAEIINAEVLNPDDVAFEAVSIGEDNLLPWLNTPVNLLPINTPPNGEVLAESAAGAAGNAEGGAMLLVRFEAGTEFYAGAGDAPAGPRTYFGFGADESGTSYYWQLTDEAKQVYLNEIKRLLEPVE